MPDKALLLKMASYVLKELAGHNTYLMRMFHADLWGLEVMLAHQRVDQVFQLLLPMHPFSVEG